MTIPSAAHSQPCSQQASGNFLERWVAKSSLQPWLVNFINAPLTLPVITPLPVMGCELYLVPPPREGATPVTVGIVTPGNPEHTLLCMLCCMRLLSDSRFTRCPCVAMAITTYQHPAWGSLNMAGVLKTSRPIYKDSELTASRTLTQHGGSLRESAFP